ncbi:hypothetical protein L9F63_018696, partial [Diploptera punctata]
VKEDTITKNEMKQNQRKSKFKLLHCLGKPSMERLWAYLTIQQLLEKDAAKDIDHNDKNQTSEKRQALELALKYSFVTPLTSLVVVKPNETRVIQKVAHKFQELTLRLLSYRLVQYLCILLFTSDSHSCALWVVFTSICDFCEMEYKFSRPATTNVLYGLPQMYYFHVESDVKYRYARTLVSTRIANPADTAQEIYFSAILPETAFISKFNMQVDGKVYEAYVKEKEEAKQEYDQAVQQGQTAAHVALTARDSNRFQVSVNVEPNKKVTFNLTYEELLVRRLNTYRDVINLDPGQIVPDFSVIVNIEESNNITSLKVPALKVTNEIDTNTQTNSANPLASIERPTTTTAVVKFNPTPEQQKELAKDGLKGQFIVEYDVDRTSNPGEVLVNDGYFVHFFSPADLPSLRKQVTFVLDVSGSMNGRKIEQLRQAMTTILGDLNTGDLFSIVLFSQSAQVWDPTVSDEEMERRLQQVGRYFPLSGEEYQAPELTSSVIVQVTPENISKAKTFINKLDALAARMRKDTIQSAQDVGQVISPALKPEPIIVFLTDGLPNVRISNGDTIVTEVTKANTKNSSIFSLALGTDADFNFLKKLSLLNSGFARKIYEAADTALQLTHFYQEIASPLLANVTFEYAPEEVENGTVTKNTFRRLFAGSELVVAGKLRQDANLTGGVEASSVTGKTGYSFRPIFIPNPIPHPPHPLQNVTNHTPSSMERMWAYLTIQQLLDKDAAKDYDHNDKNLTSPEKQRALKLAIEYSFVTPLTSLVVVKPNESKPVDTEDASQSHSGGFGGGGVALFAAHAAVYRHRIHSAIRRKYSHPPPPPQQGEDVLSSRTILAAPAPGIFLTTTYSPTLQKTEAAVSSPAS